MSEKVAFMKAALTKSKDFVSPPVSLTPFADWDYYYTGASLEWKDSANTLGNRESVAVPAGFVTDLASVPTIFWSFLSPHARYTYPAIVHDYLYWFQPCDREVADQILKCAMEEVGVKDIQVTAIYQAVHLAGSSAWAANARAKAAGERRVLKRFPFDFTTTWESWKQQPDVFD